VKAILKLLNAMQSFECWVSWQSMHCVCLLQGQRSMAVARSLGVKMCYGSDLLGALHK
jgi:hypothetical protein